AVGAPESGAGLVAGKGFGEEEGETLLWQGVFDQVVARGLQGLRIVVHAQYLARAQEQGGDAEDAGTTAEIDQVLATQVFTVQPGQTQGRGRVGAGTEGETRVEAQHDLV